MDANMPYHPASLQINSKLYICGGLTFSFQATSEFFSLSYSGVKSELSSMNFRRFNSSLSGESSQLIAIGGFSPEGMRKVLNEYE